MMKIKSLLPLLVMGLCYFNSAAYRTPFNVKEWNEASNNYTRGNTTIVTDADGSRTVSIFLPSLAENLDGIRLNGRRGTRILFQGNPAEFANWSSLEAPGDINAASGKPWNQTVVTVAGSEGWTVGSDDHGRYYQLDLNGSELFDHFYREGDDLDNDLYLDETLDSWAFVAYAYDLRFNAADEFAGATIRAYVTPIVTAQYLLDGSDADLWSQYPVSNLTTYCSNGAWNEYPDDGLCTRLDDDTRFAITYNNAVPYDQWHSQLHIFKETLAINANDHYKLSFKISSNNPIPNATFKFTNTPGETISLLMLSGVTIPAGETTFVYDNLKCEGFNSSVMVFDFAGAPANTSLEISDFRLTTSTFEDAEFAYSADGYAVSCHGSTPEWTDPVNDACCIAIAGLPEGIFSANAFAASQPAVAGSQGWSLGADNNSAFYHILLDAEAAMSCLYVAEGTLRTDLLVDPSLAEAGAYGHRIDLAFDNADRLTGAEICVYFSNITVDIPVDTGVEGATILWAGKGKEDSLVTETDIKFAFDNDPATACAFHNQPGSQWIGLDFGAPKIITAISYVLPAGDDMQLAKLAVFQAANDPSFIDAVPIHMIIPASGNALTDDERSATVEIDNPIPFRYVRYVGTGTTVGDRNVNTTACAIAELRFSVADPDEGQISAVAKGSPVYRPTNLPLVIVNTVDDRFFDYSQPNKSAANTLTKSTVIFIGENGKVNHLESKATEIRGRGNSSWRESPKKPFRIKLNKAASPLGAPASAKKWTMINNWGDKTLMRNIVGFEMGRRIGMPYAPYCIPVDLIFNGQYMGCYQFTDQLDVRPNRVDVDEAAGFLVEMDAYAFEEGGDSFFVATASLDGGAVKRDIPVTIQSPDPTGIAIPDELANATRAEIEDYFCQNDDFYRTIKGSFQDMVQKIFENDREEYLKYIDIDDFLRYAIVEDYVSNPDAFWSTYFYKDEYEQKWHTGPMWDLDIAFGNDYRMAQPSDYTSMFDLDVDNGKFGQGSYAGNIPPSDGNGGYLWGSNLYQYPNGHFAVERMLTILLQNPDNKARAKVLLSNAWNRTDGINPDDLLSFVNDLETKMTPSARLNFMRWPILTESVHMNGALPQPDSYADHVAILKDYIQSRAYSISSDEVYDRYEPFAGILVTGSFDAVSPALLWAQQNTNSVTIDAQMARVFDNDAATVPDFLGQEGVQWIGLDLGESRTVTGVGYIPAPGSDARFGIFQGANSPDFADAMPLAMITEAPVGSGMQRIALQRPAQYRYVRYVGPVTEGFNLAELRFFNDDAPAAEEPAFYRPTALPMVVVNIPDEPVFRGDVAPKHRVNTFSGATVRVLDDESNITVDAISSEIRGRGTASWDFAKKPFRIKFAKAQQPIAGGAKAKKWTMISNHNDLSLLRSMVGFEIGRRIGLDFVPGAAVVDLVFNGQYLGTYQLTDQIEIGAGRIDIPEIDRDANTFNIDDYVADGELIAGGYLVEIDAYAHTEDDGAWFEAAAGSNLVPVTVHSPDPAAKKPTQDAIYLALKADFENMLAGVYAFNAAEASTHAYRSAIDLTAMARYIVAQEYAGNPEAFWSAYAYKDLSADAPAWRFGIMGATNYGYGNDDRTPMLTADIPDYGSLASDDLTAFIGKLTSDPVLRKNMKTVWSIAINRSALDAESMGKYIDDLAADIAPSAALNHDLWGLVPAAAFNSSRRAPATSFAQSVADVKSYLAGRQTVLNSNIGYDPTLTTGISDVAVASSAISAAIVGGRLYVDGTDSCTILTPAGTIVYSGSPRTIPALAPGLYIVTAPSARPIKIALPATK